LCSCALALISKASASPILGQVDNFSSSLTPVGSPAPLGTFLRNVAEFRVLDSVDGGSLDGDTATSGFGVDNVTATPEPGGPCLPALGGVSLLIRHRRSLTAARG